MRLKFKIAGFVLLVIVVGIIINWKTAPGYNYDFQNPNLSFEERVNDLVSQLTLEEKVSQMQNAAPAIERLGIPAYNWWNECLHGVGRSGINVTVFPQAIAMASTFDTAALRLMADMTSTEARAIFNNEKKAGRFGEQYRGLTFWTPNINIFRDPRWGRGQETYGEDPFLTSMMGSSMVKGLQGNNPKYLKASACAKHFAVHSGPEAKRHEFDISVSDNDLWNTYLPAFNQLVVKDKVSSVMCAYNRFEGEPCCGNNRLMVDILRNQWGFTGYVTSDCGAIDDFYNHHKTSANATEASVSAVHVATDLECGNNSYPSLVEAVRNGKISEKEIDACVKRLFMIRMSLGMFDPDIDVPYSNISMKEVEQPAHHEHALKMARESIVLLKNDNNTLPLRKNLRKIAVVGPNATSETALLANYNGIPSKIVTALEGIKAKVGPNTKVVYEPGCGYAEPLKFNKIDLSKNFKAEGINGWKASYFENPTLSGSPKNMALVEKVNFMLNQSNDIIPGIKAENVSVRYTTTFTPEKDGRYIFEISGDDGYRLYVNNQKLLDEWYDHGLVTKSCSFHASTDSSYRITIEYYQGSGSATFTLTTGVEADNSKEALARRVKDADAIVFVGGISNEFEEEDNDRTSLDLLAVQNEYLKALKSTGKPVIFVLYTGSPLSINWEAQNLPAIINAWYGGQDAGTAIADVLFGDYNPAGRLPVTFYKSVNDLPGFEDYSMQNRTYRYFKGDVLYPFGFGLSYTKFDYSWNAKPMVNYRTTDTITFSIDIKNSGKYDGDEVVQVYFAYPENPNLPIKELKFFKRMQVQKGNTQQVKISIPVDNLKKWDSEKSSYAIYPGDYQLLVGASSSDTRLKQTITIH